MLNPGIEKTNRCQQMVSSPFLIFGLSIIPVHLYCPRATQHFPNSIWIHIPGLLLQIVPSATGGWAGFTNFNNVLNMANNIR